MMGLVLAESKSITVVSGVHGPAGEFAPSTPYTALEMEFVQTSSPPELKEVIRSWAKATDPASNAVAVAKSNLVVMTLRCYYSAHLCLQLTTRDHR